MTLGKFNWQAFSFRKPLKLIYYLHKTLHTSGRTQAGAQNTECYCLKRVVRLKHCWLNEYRTFHKIRQRVGLLSFLDHKKLQQINGEKHIVIETAYYAKAGENAPNRPWPSNVLLKRTKKIFLQTVQVILPIVYMKCITFHKQKRTYCTMDQIWARNPRRKRRGGK